MTSSKLQNFKGIIIPHFKPVIGKCHVRKYTLNLGGSDRNSFTLIDNPMSVAMLQ